MDRRTFLGNLAGGLLAAPLAAEAQPAGKSAKLGYLADGAAPIFNPIRGQLRERGWIEGQNLTVVFGLWGQYRERARDLAKDLVATDVDVIFAVGPAAAAAAKEATTTIPIVMLFSIDPVGSGLAQSLMRPGGHVTGLLWDTGADDYSAKMMEVFTAALPGARTFAALWNLDFAIHRPYFEAAEAAASRLGRRMVAAGIRAGKDLETVFRRIKADGAEAVIVYVDPLTFALRDSITTLAMSHRLPILVTAHFQFKDALIVFGPHTADMPARAANFVDRILRGAIPSDLPIEQPTKYDLKIDLRVAHVLRVTIPLSLLLRADQVIE
jgi:ABC-type uncharacterized transport system substrate-binding protein